MLYRHIYGLGGGGAPQILLTRISVAGIGAGGGPQVPGGTCSCQNVLTRLLSTSSVSYKYKDTSRFQAVSANREVKFMQKMVSGAGRAKRKHFNFNQPASEQLKDFGFLAKGPQGTVVKTMTGRVRRRIDMLNNLFVEQITSLLATGEVSPQFIGLGIQISKVKTKSDFSGINVYWFATGTEKDETIEKLLGNAAGHLRHVLSQLRVIGVVPPIQFFRDSTYSKLNEVDYLLSKCDLGEDFSTPKNLTEVVTEKGVGEAGEKAEEMEGTMRQDVLGVRHDVIMNEIMKAVQGKRERIVAKEKHINQIRSISDPSGLPEDNDDNVVDGGGGGGTLENSLFEATIEDRRKRQIEFLQYLKQRKAEKDKAFRRQSEAETEREFYSSMREERKMNLLQERLNALSGGGEEDDGDSESDTDETYNEDEYYNNQREHFKEL